MTCGGSHLGFPISIKNRGPSPMGKMFQNASSLKPLGQLKPNCPGMIIGRSSVFYTDRKSKMAATTGPMLIYVLRWRPSWISDRHKKQKFVEDLPMILPGQFAFNCPSGFREEAFQTGHECSLDGPLQS
jgi:hypothetical protein